MKIISFKFIIVLFIFCLVPPFVFSKETSGTSSMTFLKISQGARPAGMGEVFTAISDDPLALYWNPAGLARQKVPELSAQFFSFIEDTSMQNIVFAIPVPYEKPFTIAGGIVVLQSNGFKKTVVSNNTYGFEEKGEFDAIDVSVNVGAGMSINPQTNFGMSVKFMQEMLDDEKATAGAVDIGFIFKSIDHPYRLGLLAQNIGTKVKFKTKSFDLPQTFKFAVAREMSSAGWLSAEVVYANDTDLEFRTGLEVVLTKGFLMRVGYKHYLNKPEMGDYEGVTAGVGFDFSYYSLDYAAVAYGDFGMTHRVSMNFKFGKDGPQTQSSYRRIKKVFTKRTPYPSLKISASTIRAVTDTVQTHFVESGKFTIVERTHMNRVLKEQSLSLTGVVGPEKIGAIGRMIGAQYLVLGSVGKLDQVYLITVRVVEVETGAIITARKIRCSFKSELDYTAEKLSANMVDALVSKGLTTENSFAILNFTTK